jgi:hypothetical protein
MRNDEPRPLSKLRHGGKFRNRPKLPKPVGATIQEGPKALDARIAALVVHILARAALDAHERTDDVWRDFNQA